MNLHEAANAYQVIAGQLTVSERAEVEAVRAALIAADLRDSVDAFTSRINSLEIARDYAENLILTRSV